MNDLERAQALPFLGERELGDKSYAAKLRDADHSSEHQSSDRRGFVYIAKIFVRTWPYLRPYILGYWREFPHRESQGDGAQWSFSHVPPLVTLMAVLGPLTGIVPLTANWLHTLLIFMAVCMSILSWSLLFVKGRAYFSVSTALAGTAVTGFPFAVFVVEGIGDNIYMGLVSAASICMWVLQYQRSEGKIRFRVRLGSHLVYYFVLIWTSTLLLMLIALFSVDVISQSILQARPLTPFVADLIAQPEMAGQIPPVSGAVETQGQTGLANVDLAPLTIEQRHSLKWVYAVFLIFGWIVQIPLVLLLPYYYIYIMQRVNQDLRMALLERWHRLSLRYHSDHRVGDSVYRLYQDSAQVTAVIGEITQAMQVMITYGTGIIFLLALDPILGLMTMSLVVLVLIWGRWFSPQMREKSLASRKANSDFTSRVQETFASARVIKAYGAEKTEQARFERDSVNAFNASYRIRSLTAIIGIVTFTIAAAALLYGQFLTAIWAYGARETFATVLVGLVGLSFLRWNLSAYQSAQEQLGTSSVAMRDLIDRWAKAQDMAMGLHRVFDILDIEPDVENSIDAIPMPEFSNEIRFNGVSFAYEPTRPVLSDVSFAVKPGSVTAIVGPTGSGKSSLMSLLSRLFDPDSGSVTIDGVDIRAIELDSLRANVSVALQENVLFGMSLRDNIRYALPHATDEQVLEAARVACVEEYITSLPDGLDTVLSDRGGKLSTGQRQRLSIARALVKDTPILILDEPTAALDAATEHQVLERLASWGEKRAVFLITHRISTIQKADRILYIDRGRLLEHGSHAELMLIEGGRYRNFVETEARLSKRLNSHQPAEVEK